MPNRSSKQGLELAKQASGEGHPDYARALSHLALLYAARRNLDRSPAMLSRALDIDTAFFEKTAPALSERRQLELLDQLRGELHAYLSHRTTGGGPAADLYRRVLDWKGIAFARWADLAVRATTPS